MQHFAMVTNQAPYRLYFTKKLYDATVPGQQHEQMYNKK